MKHGYDPDNDDDDDDIVSNPSETEDGNIVKPKGHGAESGHSVTSL